MKKIESRFWLNSKNTYYRFLFTKMDWRVGIESLWLKSKHCGKRLESSELLEKIAELEHDQWCVWADNLLVTEPDLSPERKSRWKQLTSKLYSQLSEQEKEQDREWARKILEVLLEEEQAE